jgi:hypothetical protein
MRVLVHAQRAIVGDEDVDAQIELLPTHQKGVVEVATDDICLLMYCLAARLARAARERGREGRKGRISVDKGYEGRLEGGRDHGMRGDRDPFDFALFFTVPTPLLDLCELVDDEDTLKEIEERRG